MMTTEWRTHVNTICELMRRANLKGEEVQAYSDAWNWLQDIISGRKLVVLSEEEYRRLLDQVEDVVAKHNNLEEKYLKLCRRLSGVDDPK